MNGVGPLKPIRSTAAAEAIIARKKREGSCGALEPRSPSMNGKRARRGGFQSLEEAQVPVLHESEDFLVINKPPDFRLDGDFAVTVNKFVRGRIPKLDKPRWIHQLDFATSGVLCIGLKKLSAGNACGLFRERLTRKFYLALVRGRLRKADPAIALQPETGKPNVFFDCSSEGKVCEPSSGNVNFSERFTWRNFKFSPKLNDIQVTEKWEPASNFGVAQGEIMKQLLQIWYPSAPHLPVYEVCGAIAKPQTEDFRMLVENETGRAAATQIVPLEYGTINGEAVTKVLMKPIHGRRHQLRLHCLHLGFPIVGDATYGPVYCDAVGESRTSFYEGVDRMMLHALRLDLPFKSEARKIRLVSFFFWKAHMTCEIVTNKQRYRKV